ncbi:MAG: HU family DNA-binding protein [Prevotella sp.]|nr:HU family DNA-binding protein [Prevotella sp.]
MAVKYRLYQEQRKTSPNKGKWYARAVVDDVVRLDEISREIQENTTAKQADVYAVLSELVNSMSRHLKNGDRVVLDGFGSFKVGLSSAAAETPKDFNPATHIRGIRLNFQPETRWTATDRTRRKQFLQGIELKQIGQSSPSAPKPEEP